MIKSKLLNSSAVVAPERCEPASDAELMTTAEFAQYRRCSLRTLDRERAEGRGCPYLRIGSRILYRRRDVDSWIEAQIRGTDFKKAHAAPDLQPRRRPPARTDLTEHDAKGA